MIENKDINSVAMSVILNAGNGRICVDNALERMSKLDFEEAEKLLNDAENEILKAHIAQTEMIQGQVAGANVEYSLLFIHAQDTVMTINTELRMAKNLMPIFKTLKQQINK